MCSIVVEFLVFVVSLYLLIKGFYINWENIFIEVPLRILY